MSGIQNYKTAKEFSNQGIVDGRQAGEQPKGAPTTLDTYTDKDASASDPRVFSAHQELPGATSKDVYESAGKPGSGMSSKEQRHNAQPGRKKEGFGTEARFGSDKGFSEEVEL